MPQFRCTGTDCEDNCCGGWNVDIDAETHQMYRDMQAGDLCSRLVDNLIVHTEPTAGKSARIRMSGEDRCPFLGSDRLCEIHKSLGENYLSHICAGYPREHSFVDGGKERTLSLSCPEAARKVLLERDGLSLITVDEAHSRRDLTCHRVISTRNPLDGYECHRHFWAGRIFCLGLLKNRRYTVAERLILLGLVCRRLNALVVAREVDSIPETLETFQEEIGSDAARTILEGIPSSLDVQWAILSALSDDRLTAGVRHAGFLRCWKEFRLGLGWTSGCSKKDVIARYTEAYNDYFKPFFDEHMYIFENYCVNHAFRHLLPFGEKATILDEFSLLSVNFSLLRLVLTGVGAHNGKLTTGDAVRVVQGYARVYENAGGFRKQILALLETAGVNTFPHMTVLLGAGV